MSSPTEVIESFVHGSKSVLSFRRLSSLLQVPFHTAQKHLVDYVSSKGEQSVTVLWQVSKKVEVGRTRTILTTAPSTNTSLKCIWAIAPLNTPTSSAVWLQPDHQLRLDQTKEPFHQLNALRDGRFLSVSSPTAAWDTRPDPRSGALASPLASFGSRKTSNLLNNVKQAPKRSPQSAFKSSSTTAPAKNSLFTSKRLGQDSADRMKANQNTSTGTIFPAKGPPNSSVGSSQSRGLHRNNDSDRKETKKSRRIISDDEEDDAVGHSKLEDSEEDAEDDANSIEILEQRAFEKERTEEEQAEIERELRELTGEDVDEPESPVLKDIDDEEVVRKEVDANGKGPQQEPVKRSFRETFGLPDEENVGRRIRKEVEVHEEQPDGYIVTRRVMKTFDENGNELDSDEPQKKNVARDSDQDISCLPTKSLKSMKSLSKNQSQTSLGKEKSSSTGGLSNVKDSKKNGKSLSNSKAGIRKKSKKITVDIKSYFGKK